MSDNKEPVDKDAKKEKVIRYLTYAITASITACIMISAVSVYRSARSRQDETNES